VTDRITGGLLLIVTLGYAYQAYHLKVGFMSDPIGPKAFPLIIAGLLALFSLYLFVKPDEEPDWPIWKVWRNKSLVLISFIFYAYALVSLGFLLATTLEIAFLALMFQGKLWKGLVTGIISSLFLYSMFVYILGIPLPLGKIFGG
jgi:putative tricarboxylic transport membrane protein